MSVKTTLTITREQAINRILQVCDWIRQSDYLKIDEASYEVHHTIQEFVQAGIDFDIIYIYNWTNKMLEDIMGRPFFRYSMFDNYMVKGELCSSNISTLSD